MYVLIVDGQIQRQIGDKTLQRRGDDVYLIGNPQGDISSRDDVRRLLTGFREPAIFAGSLSSWLEVQSGGVQPLRRLWLVSRRSGWGFYAMERHAAARCSR